jgi:hypothetical protein
MKHSRQTWAGSFDLHVVVLMVFLLPLAALISHPYWVGAGLALVPQGLILTRANDRRAHGGSFALYTVVNELSVAVVLAAYLALSLRHS